MPLIVIESLSQSVSAMQERACAERDDQRVDTENGDQETVDEADCNPERKRRDHRPADADLVVDVEDRDQHRRQRHDERDREIEIVGGEGNDEPERHHHEHRLGAQDRREIGPGQERVGPQIAEDCDEQEPHDDQPELLEPVDERLVRRALGRGGCLSGRRIGHGPPLWWTNVPPVMRGSEPAKAALRDGLLVDFSAFEDRDDPAGREDQHAAADRGELLVVRTGAKDRRARCAALAICRKTVCRAPMSTPCVGSSSRISFGSIWNHLASTTFC